MFYSQQSFEAGQSSPYFTDRETEAGSLAPYHLKVLLYNKELLLKLGTSHFTRIYY